jgi:hypothetical protein
MGAINETGILNSRPVRPRRLSGHKSLKICERSRLGVLVLDLWARRLISTALGGCRYYLLDDPGGATFLESTKLFADACVIFAGGS